MTKNGNTMNTFFKFVQYIVNLSIVKEKQFN